MPNLPVFDFKALIDALNAKRAEQELGWTAVAGELWQQSSDLNAQLQDNAMCQGALVRHVNQPGPMSCQYALTLLRWIGRPPEDFLTGPVVEVGETQLPQVGPESRLRWDLPKLHTALNAHRNEHELTWAALARELSCTPSRLTNLRSARLAAMDLTMCVTQRLGRPAADFIGPAQW